MNQQFEGYDRVLMVGKAVKIKADELPWWNDEYNCDIWMWWAEHKGFQGEVFKEGSNSTDVYSVFNGYDTSDEFKSWYKDNSMPFYLGHSGCPYMFDEEAYLFDAAYSTGICVEHGGVEKLIDGDFDKFASISRSKGSSCDFAFLDFLNKHKITILENMGCIKLIMEKE